MTSSTIAYILARHKTLALMILLMPFSNTPELGSNLFGIPGFKPLNVVAIAVFALWLYKGGEVLTYRDPIRFRASMIYFVYIGIFTIEFSRSVFDLNILVSRYSIDFIDFYGAPFNYILSYWFKPLVITGSFVYILNHIKNRNGVEAVVDLLLLSYLIFAIATLTISTDIILSGQDRNVLGEAFHDSLGFHYNNVGTILMLAVPLALNRALTRGKAWLVVLIVILAALLLSQSRGAIIGAAAGVLAFFYLQRSISFAAIAILLLIASVGVWLAEPLQALFSHGVATGDLSKITSGRIDSMWLPLIHELSENPFALIFGFGLFGVIMSDSYVLVPNFYQATHAHNAYIDLLVDGGLIVFVPFMFLLVYSLKQAWKWSKKLGNSTYNSLLSSVVVYLVASISERKLFPALDNMMLLPVVALLLVIVIYERKTATRQQNELVNSICLE